MYECMYDQDSSRKTIKNILTIYNNYYSGRKFVMGNHVTSHNLRVLSCGWKREDPGNEVVQVNP